MTTTEDPSRRERFTIYGVIAVVLVLLMIIGLIVWQPRKSERESREKADSLIAAICANPNAPLRKAARLEQLTNGAAGPGTRPVLADSRALRGELLVIANYCPAELAGLQQFVRDLKTANVAGE